MRLVFFLLLLSLKAFAHSASTVDQACHDMEVWDPQLGMCEPLAMAGMPMRMLMLHANGFLLDNTSAAPRGRDRLAVPHMLMMDLGSSVGDRHYLNVDVMGTFEKWTFPHDGNPELLQMGEKNEDHVPYVDAQHPHSSPLMGLTVSDTFTLEGDRNYLKIFLAPRGASTDGPIAFMHRPTGMVNPNAPLGHHVAQDAGHISSSVVGVKLKEEKNTFEISTFSGTEPHPDRVDLPVYTPNSYALRVSRDFNPNLLAMASVAYVKSPEADEPDLDHLWRYSLSAYSRYELSSEWVFQNALIYGLINSLDHASALNSFSEEFLFHRDRVADFWARIEYLQRTPDELMIEDSEPDVGQWITALTFGYTHPCLSGEQGQVGLGFSVTEDILPSEFQESYGKGNAWSAQIFLQANGMKMWDF